MLAGVDPMQAAIVSGSGMILSKSFASFGLNPSGRSASSSTRCSTPTVIRRPQTGQTPPAAAVSAGVRHTLQPRCPSI